MPSLGIISVCVPFSCRRFLRCADECRVFICHGWYFSFDDRLTLTLWLTALLTSRLGFKPSPSQRTLHSFDSQRLLAQSSEEISSVSSQYNDRRQTKLNNTRYVCVCVCNHWFFVPRETFLTAHLTFFWLSSAPIECLVPTREMHNSHGACDGYKFSWMWVVGPATLQVLCCHTHATAHSAHFRLTH
jgi:hypothetical protein